MSTPSGAPRAELLSIGDELLYGDIVDTNAVHMARRLRLLGLALGHKQTVGDELDEIVAAFKLALSRAEVVIATGGLGPTDDDLTVEAVAKALGVPVEHREEVMDQMAERLKRPKETLGGSNRKQALVPRGAEVLRNHWGTAPGLHLDAGAGRHIFLMAGVPREMKNILETYVEPFIRATWPAPRAILTRHLHCVGLGESIVGERIKEFMAPGRNPDVGTRVELGVVSVRAVARGASEAEALALLEPLLVQIRERLADHLFGEETETLASATVKALAGRGLTLALAESCTAGLVAAALGEVPGLSKTFLEGAVTYSNEAKTRACGVKPETLKAHGAVSAETAAELAEGIRKRAGADIGLSVTGIAGPDGGTDEKPVGLVFFGIATPAGVTVERRVMAGQERNVFRERAMMLALDFIRRAALGNAPSGS